MDRNPEGFLDGRYENQRDRFIYGAPHRNRPAKGLQSDNNYVTDEDYNSIVLDEFEKTVPYSFLNPHMGKSYGNMPYRSYEESQSTLRLAEGAEQERFGKDTNYIKGDPFDDRNVFTTELENAFSNRVESEEEKFRRNEKARLKQLRSKPRFHYTRLPYFVIIVTLIQVIVFIVELIKMSILTGSAFQTKPYFNPMLGPSTYLLINMGARYAPCMHSIKDITADTSILFPCPNSTSTSTNVCSLNELCGLSGISHHDGQWQPNQWYRIFVPIFLHAGFLHIIFNLLLQVTMGSTIERNIGCIKFGIIYLMSGISGFLLGANFSPIGIASTGASGALFGVVATNIIMFIFCGKKNTNMYGSKRYGILICLMIGEIIVSLVLGLLPGLDNFSHIGGFAIGILMAIVLLPDPFFVYEDGIIAYDYGLNTWQEFKNNWNPYYHYEDKIPSRFYIWMFVRIISIALVILYMCLLIHNFFGTGERSGNNNCSWCEYINCIPVNGWCDIGQVSVQETNGNKKLKRDAFTSLISDVFTLTSEVQAYS